MIKALHCTLDGDRAFKRIDDVEQISDFLNKKALLWLDLLEPTAEELQKVAKEFNFHPLAVEDASHNHQRPKIDDYEDYFLIVFYTIALNPETHQLDFCELKMFVSEQYLVTVHYQPIKELDEAEQRWRRNAHQIEHGIGILLYSVMDTIVDHYFPVVDNLAEVAEDLEDQILEGKNNEQNFTRRVLDLKKLFLQLRRAVGPERDVLNTLTNRDSPIFGENSLIYFRDIHDHLMRVADTIDLYRDLVSGTMDANLAAVSNDLNKVMRTLTGTSIILMTNALIAGIYGMNFENMPELHWPFGYFYALGLMIVVSAGLYYLFKRRNWL